MSSSTDATLRQRTATSKPASASAAPATTTAPAVGKGYDAFADEKHVSWTWWFMTVCGLVVVPLFMYWCWVCLEYNQGLMLLPKAYTADAIVAWWRDDVWVRIMDKCIPGREAWTIYLLWNAFQAVLFVYGPGHKQKGVVLADGSRITYTFNGQFAFFVTLITAALLHFSGLWRITILVDLYPQLLTVALLFTSIVIGLLHLRAIVRNSVEHRTDSLLYDYFMGPELNPFVGPLDVKFFFELRPGIMHWFFTTLAFAAKQYEEHGQLSLNMMCIVFMHLCFVNACYKGEHCVIWSIDIIHEKFGWMLMMLDLVMVPFVFPMQPFYIYKQGLPELPLWWIALWFTSHCVAYFIFDTANSQKDYFREVPSEAVPSGFPRLPYGRLHNPKYIQTKRGTKLLIDGWWAWSRHMNYLGDIIMSWSWGFICGTGSYFPFAYTTYLTPLLIHRELRDDRQCAAKYGDDWVEYKKLVPYRIIPYIY